MRIFEVGVTDVAFADGNVGVEEEFRPQHFYFEQENVQKIYQIDYYFQKK